MLRSLFSFLFLTPFLSNSDLEHPLICVFQSSCILALAHRSGGPPLPKNVYCFDLHSSPVILLDRNQQQRCNNE